MDDKTRQEFINLFNQGFQELVVPQLDELIEGQERIENRLETIEIRFDVVERKLDRVVDDHIEIKSKVEEHDKQIKRLTIRRSIST